MCKTRELKKPSPIHRKTISYILPGPESEARGTRKTRISYIGNNGTNYNNVNIDTKKFS